MNKTLRCGLCHNCIARNTWNEIFRLADRIDPSGKPVSLRILDIYKLMNTAI